MVTATGSERPLTEQEEKEQNIERFFKWLKSLNANDIDGPENLILQIKEAWLDEVGDVDLEYIIRNWSE